jgi:hypothetical protein
MPPLLVFIVIAALAGCAGPHRPTSEQRGESNGLQPANSEPAPVVRPIDYLMPPDSRDKLCGESNIADRTNSFATVTKATTSYYCF